MLDLDPFQSHMTSSQLDYICRESIPKTQPCLSTLCRFKIFLPIFQECDSFNIFSTQMRTVILSKMWTGGVSFLFSCISRWPHCVPLLRSQPLFTWTCQSSSRANECRVGGVPACEWRVMWKRKWYNYTIISKIKKNHLIKKENSWVANQVQQYMHVVSFLLGGWGKLLVLGQPRLHTETLSGEKKLSWKLALISAMEIFTLI